MIRRQEPYARDCAIVVLETEPFAMEVLGTEAFVIGVLETETFAMGVLGTEAFATGVLEADTFALETFGGEGCICDAKLLVGLSARVT